MVIDTEAPVMKDTGATVKPASMRNLDIEVIVETLDAMKDLITEAPITALVTKRNRSTIEAPTIAHAAKNVQTKNEPTVR